ncbi:MAG: hypothetical protein JO019_03240, partial [Candidatus Kaiserbacteria bacterium]|nr:hypothetical protein [Candidatus Kaiserbacteria bacterium]
GFKMIGVRRPAIGPKVADMRVDVYQSADLARVDTADANAQVISLESCGDFVRYQVLVSRVPDADDATKLWDVAEVPVPANAKDVKIASGSITVQKYWAGSFDGNFEKGVTLTEQTMPVTPNRTAKNYKW